MARNSLTWYKPLELTFLTLTKSPRKATILYDGTNEHYLRSVFTYDSLETTIAPNTLIKWSNK